MTRLIVLVLVLAASAGCRKSNEKAKAERAEDDAPRVITAKDRLAMVEAEIGLASAFDAAAMAALRKVETEGRKETATPPEELSTDSTREFTIFFGANNHGEREDCGCRRNPLGGLARRHAMLEALETEEAAEIWGAMGKAEGPVFHLDAGDALFANSTINRGTENAQAIAKHDAKAVVDALSTFPPDAMLAGDIEFAFGAEELKNLLKGAKFPVISANVREAGGELVFPPSVVVEREGVKLGIVGVTKKDNRWGTYWEDRGLEVDEPLKAVERAVAELPEDVTMVVLLSNLGLPGTQNLLNVLDRDKADVDFAAVSSTNRMTAEPDFASGTPYMEPLSRGKYVGRVDFMVNGDDVDFRNAGQATPSRLRQHRRAVRSYWATRKQILRSEQNIAELQVSLENVQREAHKADGGLTNQLESRRSDAVMAEQKRLETLEERLATVSQAMLDQVASFEPKGEAATGDDWVNGGVVPVKIEFPQEPSTRRIIDRAEKRRPKKEVRRPMKRRGE